MPVKTIDNGIGNETVNNEFVKDEHIKEEKFRQMLIGAKRAVFFGGAGVSTESGVPDFRSQDGLYRQQWRYPPETILSHTFFMRNTEEFFRFYRQKMLFPGARPNAAHRALAKLEQTGHLQRVITQNIDGLHQAAGSVRVTELHGSVLRNFCMRCGRAYPGLQPMLGEEPVPRCACGGIIKPDVVLYEESLKPEDIETAVEAVDQADLLIVGGTSLTVYPAAAFVQSFRGPVVVINKTPTPMDQRADLLFDRPIGSVLDRVVNDL